MKDVKIYAQTVWGIVLTIMGIAFFFRIPYVMERISNIKQYASELIYIRLSLYLMVVLLVGGGVQKLMAITKYRKKGSTNH